MALQPLREFAEGVGRRQVRVASTAVKSVAVLMEDFEHPPHLAVILLGGAKVQPHVGHGLMAVWAGDFSRSTFESSFRREIVLFVNLPPLPVLEGFPAAEACEVVAIVMKSIAAHRIGLRTRKGGSSESAIFGLARKLLPGRSETRTLS